MLCCKQYVGITNYKCVQTIRENTNPSQWRYIESKNNPADDASRGLNGAQLLKQRRWFEGPSFLWKPIIEKPICPIVLKTIPCAAQDMCLANVVEESYSGDMLRWLLRFSDWHRLKVVVWLLRARLTRRDTKLFVTKPLHYKPRPISLDEIEKADIVVLKLIKRDAFFKEIETIRERQKKRKKRNWYSRLTY